MKDFTCSATKQVNHLFAGGYSLDSIDFPDQENSTISENREGLFFTYRHAVAFTGDLTRGCTPISSAILVPKRRTTHRMRMGPRRKPAPNTIAKQKPPGFRICMTAGYFLGGTIASLKVLEGLTFTTVLAGILIAAPV